MKRPKIFTKLYLRCITVVHIKVGLQGVKSPEFLFHCPIFPIYLQTPWKLTLVHLEGDGQVFLGKNARF